MVAGILGVEDVLIDDKRCASGVCCVPNPTKPNSTSYLKVVGNEKVGGVGKMPNVHNMCLTVAIDVLFSVNFAVVFDFMYFRFRPSKAK